MIVNLLGHYYYYFFIYYFLVFAIIIIKYITLRNNLEILNYKYFLTFYFLCWLGLCIFSFLGMDSNDILIRQGVWLNLNIISVLFPITRNSFFINSLKIDTESTKKIHQFISILFVCCLIIKISYLFIKNKSVIFIEFKNFNNGIPLSGTIASFFVILINLLSIPIIRKKFFEIFYYSHRLLSLIIIIFSSIHHISSFLYCIPVNILYIVDIIIRFINIHKTSFMIVKITENTKIIILKVKLQKSIENNPGCYFLVNINDISKYEWHPLSYIQNKDYVTFFVKDLGENTWSNSILKNRIITKVYLQGPYKTSYININSLNIYFICSGLGIVPILSIIKNDKIEDYKNIKLFWLISDLSYLKIFEEYLKDLKIIVFCQSYYDFYVDIDLEIKFEKANIQKIFKENIKNTNKYTIIYSGSNKLCKDINIIKYDYKKVKFFKT